MKMFERSLLFVFVLIFDSGFASPENQTSGVQDALDKQIQRLKDSESILTMFEYAFDEALQSSYPSNAFGVLFDESFGWNEENGSKLSEDARNFYFYFYDSIPITTNPIRVLANFRVTHIATWLNLNFQTCISFYANDKKFEPISKNCERLSASLEAFISNASHIKTYQFARFKNESPNHVKETESPTEKQTKVIPKRLKEAIRVKEVTEPDTQKCKQMEDGDERKYCEIWMRKLIDQPVDFKLNHIFFDVYSGLKKSDYDVYDVNSYTSDYNSSAALWKYIPNLLEKINEKLTIQQNDRKISSFAINALIAIMDYKISQFNIDPSTLTTVIPDMSNLPAVETYFQGDEAPTDNA